jgi:GPH family glycoside/pentoside/hexuronide:cation symporter
MANAFSYLALPFFNVILKVDATMVGWGMGLPRLWDAISDVLMGNITDNARSRWGRRRPFIFIGGILSGLMFALVWMPPAAATPTVIGAYFIGLSLLFYTAYTLFSVPWGALGLELTDDYHDRTTVQVWKVVVQGIGGTALGYLLPLSLNIGKDPVEGMRYVGIIFGTLIAVAAIVPAIFCRERVHVEAQARLSYWSTIRATFANRSFLCIIGYTTFTVIGVFLVNSFAFYINLYHVFGGEMNASSMLGGHANAIFQWAGIALAPVVAIVSRRLGKRATLLTGFSLVAVGFASSWWTYTPSAPYLQLVSLALISPGLGCLWVLGPSMLADTCAHDSETTGLKRAGMFNASFVWSIKVGISAALILSGYMVKWSGVDPELAVQPTGVLVNLRLLYATIPVFFLFCAACFVFAYPKRRGEK